MRKLSFAVAAALLSATAAFSAPASVVSEAPAAQLGAEQITVRSPSLGREFLIEVMPPHSPRLHPDQRFPAIYALDGGYGIAGMAGRLLGGTGASANAYVVSVGYRPSEYGRRNHDLLWRPTRFMGGEVGGGGEAFARFLLEELRPFIEARYPVEPKQAVLVGNSASGLFGANLLARRPGAFQGYVLASPSFWLEPEAMDRMAAARGSGEAVIIGVGGKEEARMTEAAASLARALQGRFKVETRVYPTANHNGFYAQLLLDALPIVLPSRQRPEAPAHRLLTEATARPFVGDYRLTDGRAVKISLLDGFLWADLAGGGRAGFITEDEGRFYAVGLDTQLTIHGRSLTLSMPGASYRGIRTD